MASPLLKRLFKKPETVNPEATAASMGNLGENTERLLDKMASGSRYPVGSLVFYNGAPYVIRGSFYTDDEMFGKLSYILQETGSSRKNWIKRMKEEAPALTNWNVEELAKKTNANMKKNARFEDPNFKTLPKEPMYTRIFGLPGSTPIQESDLRPAEEVPMGKIGINYNRRLVYRTLIRRETRRGGARRRRRHTRRR